MKGIAGCVITHSRSENVKTTCCLAPKLPFENLKWLPDPVLNAKDDHYLPYSEVKLLPETNETDRPTLKKPKVQQQKKKEVAGTSSNF